MEFFKPFTVREQEQIREKPDVYEYDEVPKPLRVQLIRLVGYLSDAISSDITDRAFEGFMLEHGLDEIKGVAFNAGGLRSIQDFFSNYSDLRILDVLEFVVLEAFNISRSRPVRHDAWSQSVKGFIDQMNYRFKQNNFGYEFSNGEFVRIDSQYMHQEVVQEVLHLVAFPGFESVNAEFMSAHMKYRNKDYRGCIADCGNAFESTLKVICDRNGWEYKKGQATALVDLCKEKGLFDAFHVESLNHLAGVLKSSVPVPRNQVASHGHGSEPKEITEAIAKFCLHSAASHILFLIECDGS